MMFNFSTMNFIAVPANDNTNLFTPSQKLFWQKLYGEAESIKPIRREDFQPELFYEFLPNIWLADLEVSEEKKVVDVNVRLFGTKLVSIYGERTKQNLLTDNDENSFQTQMRFSFERLSLLLQEMLRTMCPLYSSTDYFEEHKNYLVVTGLMVPMCRDGDTINMVLGYIEFRYKNENQPT